MPKPQARQEFGRLDFFQEASLKRIFSMQDLKHFIGECQMFSLTMKTRCSIENLLAKSNLTPGRARRGSCNSCASNWGTTDDCGFSPFCDDTSTTRDTAFAKIPGPGRRHPTGLANNFRK